MNHPPYVFSQGNKRGLALDLLEAALGTDFTLKLQIYPPARARDSFLRGQFPISIHSIPGGSSAITRIPWMKVNLQFYQNETRGLVPWNKPGDLRGKVLAIYRPAQEGDSQNLAQNLQKEGLKLYPIETLEQGFRMLDLGRVDLVFSEEVTGNFTRSQISSGSLSSRIRGATFMVFPGAVTFNTDLPLGKQAAEAFTHGWTPLVKSGRAAQIAESYLGKGNVPEDFFLIPPP